MQTFSSPSPLCVEQHASFPDWDSKVRKRPGHDVGRSAIRRTPCATPRGVRHRNKAFRAARVFRAVVGTAEARL
jgi:hypothetical protein